jgi:hypothetical protein
MADAPSWKIPRIVASVFFGIILTGIVMVVLVPLLGVVPYWLPWPLSIACVAAVHWGLGRVKREN